ncbi:ABC transporter ATP-binding protein, partial [Azospirillum brasilense]|nr:ABC transporter ATP-binding protein [Azospirillum brasilense]
AAVSPAGQGSRAALSAAGRVVLLRLGRAVHDGPVENLPTDALRDAFLGG